MPYNIDNVHSDFGLLIVVWSGKGEAILGF